jgi:tetratricopeptide (TPR) repeat protein
LLAFAVILSRPSCDRAPQDDGFSPAADIVAPEEPDENEPALSPLLKVDPKAMMSRAPTPTLASGPPPESAAAPETGPEKPKPAIPPRALLPYVRTETMMSPNRNTGTAGMMKAASPGELQLQLWADTRQAMAPGVFSDVAAPSVLSKLSDEYNAAWITNVHREKEEQTSPRQALLDPTAQAAPATTAIEAPAPTGDPDRMARAMYYLREAEARMSEGLLDIAFASYTQALDVFPGMIYAHQKLGRLCLRQGKYELAIRHLAAALESDENIEEILNDLGIAYLYSGRAAEALNNFEGALQANPEATAPLFNAGLAHRRLGQITEARGRLLAYQALAGDDARSIRELAMLDVIESNRGGALTRLEQAMRKDKTWYTPVLDAALIHAELGDAGNALAYLERALELAPAWAVHQVYTQPPFRDIRLGPESKAFEARLAVRARGQL